MKIVIDVNILFSALIRDSSTRHYIIESNNDFFIPRVALESLMKYQAMILRKSSATENELKELLKSLLTRIKLVPRAVFSKDLDKALDVMRDIDEEDSVFVACSLSISGSIIWSDDKHLKKQKLVKVCTTEELFSR